MKLKIKKLEWENILCEFYQCSNIFARYVIEQRGEVFLLAVLNHAGGLISKSEHPTLDEAKAKAQQIFEERVMQFLDVEKEPETKYKVGDKVRVVDCINDHGFEIGEIVTIDRFDYEFPECPWICERNGIEWWLSESEFEPAEKGE